MEGADMIINARSTDPLSSHLAGHEVEANGVASHQRQIAFNAVKAHPGMTSKELAQLCHECRYMLARRLPEISEIEKGEMRECAVSGRQSVTWKLRECQN
jgi:predicted transcriptional regulator